MRIFFFGFREHLVMLIYRNPCAQLSFVHSLKMTFSRISHLPAHSRLEATPILVPLHWIRPIVFNPPPLPPPPATPRHWRFPQAVGFSTSQRCRSKGGCTVDEKRDSRYRFFFFHFLFYVNGKGNGSASFENSSQTYGSTLCLFLQITKKGNLSSVWQKMEYFDIFKRR